MALSKDVSTVAAGLDSHGIDRDGFPDMLKGKRILLTTESLGPVNGVSRTTGSLVEYLQRHGADLVVVAPRFEGIQDHQNDHDHKFHFSRELRIPGYPLPYNPDLTVVYPFYIDDIYRQTFEPDMVYVASPASLGFQMLLQIRQLQRPPVVLLNFQTDLSAYCEILLPAPLDRFGVWLLSTVQGYLFSQPAVHTIFYPSSATVGYLEKAGAPRNRLRQLGRGVDTSLFNPMGRDEAYRQTIAPNGEIILVYVCRLAPEKGFEFLAQAATRLAKDRLPFKLLIVGGNRNPAVEDQIHRLFDPVRDYVIFTGFLSGEALSRAYAAGDLFLHCSITETFGLVVLEAMASGLPVIARDQGGPSDIVRNHQTGYLVPPHDLDTFVALVHQVVLDTQLRFTLARAARAYAEEMTWEMINRRVAWQIADAFLEGQTRSRYLAQPMSKNVSGPCRAMNSGLWVLIEKLQLLVAVGTVYFMWFIAVVPLIVHGERMIPRALRAISTLPFVMDPLRWKLLN